VQKKTHSALISEIRLWERASGHPCCRAPPHATQPLCIVGSLAGVCGANRRRSFRADPALSVRWTRLVGADPDAAAAPCARGPRRAALPPTAIHGKAGAGWPRSSAAAAAAEQQRRLSGRAERPNCRAAEDRDFSWRIGNQEIATAPSKDTHTALCSPEARACKIHTRIGRAAAAALNAAASWSCLRSALPNPACPRSVSRATWLPSSLRGPRLSSRAAVQCGLANRATALPRLSATQRVAHRRLCLFGKGSSRPCCCCLSLLRGRLRLVAARRRALRLASRRVVGVRAFRHLTLLLPAESSGVCISFGIRSGAGHRREAERARKPVATLFFFAPRASRANREEDKDRN
jgi:hypothetical protein